MYRLVFCSRYWWEKHTYCVWFWKCILKISTNASDKLQRKVWVSQCLTRQLFQNKVDYQAFFPKHAEEAQNRHQIYFRGCWLDPTYLQGLAMTQLFLFACDCDWTCAPPCKTEPQVQLWPSVIKHTRKWICERLILFLLHMVLFCKQQLFRSKLYDFLHTEAQKAAWGFELLNSSLHGYLNLIK